MKRGSGALPGRLAVSEDFLRGAPANLYLQLYRADTQEGLGRYFSALAARRPELRVEARTWFQKSFALWQDWMLRNIGTPYAANRQRQAAAYLASAISRNPPNPHIRDHL